MARLAAGPAPGLARQPADGGHRRRGLPEAAGETAEIVITVGVPGQNVGGALWNERRGVIAYTEPKAATDAQTAAGVLARIRDRLIEKGVSC